MKRRPLTNLETFTRLLFAGFLYGAAGALLYGLFLLAILLALGALL